MKKILLVSIIFFGMFQQQMLACTCAAPSTFCEGILDQNGNIYFDLIARGKITANTNSGIDVKIGDIIYGTSNENEISVGFSFCTIFQDPLEVDKEYIFAVSKYNDNYYLGLCNISYLVIEDEIIKGKIAPGIESLDYSDLEELEGCGDDLNIFSIEKNIAIFPNPTSDILKIKNTSHNFFALDVQVEFYDALGRQLRGFKKEDGILAGSNWLINIEEFSKGVYFLRLSANRQETVFRIVKL